MHQELLLLLYLDPLCSMCAALHQHHDHDDHSRNQSSLSKGEDNESSSRIIYWKNKAKKGRGADGRNINVRAAFIHVIGDLIQSIGVVIAGYIIKFFVSNFNSMCSYSTDVGFSLTASMASCRLHLYFYILNFCHNINSQCTERCYTNTYGRYVR